MAEGEQSADRSDSTSLNQDNYTEESHKENIHKRCHRIIRKETDALLYT